MQWPITERLNRVRGYHAPNSHSSTLIIALMLPLGLDFFEIENSYRPMP